MAICEVCSTVRDAIELSVNDLISFDIYSPLEIMGDRLVPFPIVLLCGTNTIALMSRANHESNGLWTSKTSPTMGIRAIFKSIPVFAGILREGANASNRRNAWFHVREEPNHVAIISHEPVSIN